MSEPKQEERVERERLRALARIGLAVGTAYTAPTIVSIPRAYASSSSPGGDDDDFGDGDSGDGGGRGRGREWD